MYVTVEGQLDVVVAGAILSHLGIASTRISPEAGRDTIRGMLPKICEASKWNAWLVIVDLDDEDCAASLVRAWLRAHDRDLTLRVAVLIPSNPESIAHPKDFVVELAARSRKRTIREGIVPRPGGLRKRGPDYTLLLSDFARRVWRIPSAAKARPSLFSCLRALEVKAAKRG